MSPTWVMSAPDGPHVGPMKLGWLRRPASNPGLTRGKATCVFSIQNHFPVYGYTCILFIYPYTGKWFWIEKTHHCLVYGCIHVCIINVYTHTGKWLWIGNNSLFTYRLSCRGSCKKLILDSPSVWCASTQLTWHRYRNSFTPGYDIYVHNFEVVAQGNYFESKRYKLPSSGETGMIHVHLTR